MYFLLFISLAITVYLVVQRIISEKKVKTSTQYSSHVNNSNNLNSSLQNNYMETINSSEISLSHGILVNTSSNDTVLLQNSPTALIFYIPRENCSVCIEEELSGLQTRFPKEFSEGRKILIIREIENYRFWKVFENQINHKVLKLIHGLESIPLYEKQIPFYFILDKNNLVKDVFIPDKNQVQLHNNYFDLVSRVFQTK